VLTLTSGGLLVTGSGDYAITNGSLSMNSQGLSIHHLGSGVLTIDSAINGPGGALTTDGPGTVALGGTQNYATLNTNSGTTNLAGTLGTGNSTINANISASQTLAALNIGAGAEVSFGSGAFVSLGEISTFGGSAGPTYEAVPEPSAMALLVVGVLGFCGRRRRK
jgi:hypothetical protein